MAPPLSTEHVDHRKADGFVLNVESCVPLRRATSTISSAGSGMIAGKRILANQEIFRLKQPLMNVLTEKHMSDTCDNCFLWTGSTLRQAIDPSIVLSVSSCNGCKVVRYCSKACQAKAWRRHHKTECKLWGVPMRQPDYRPHSDADALAPLKVFSEVLLMPSIRYNAHRSEGIAPSVRAIVRLLHLRASGQLTEGQWRSLLSLESHGEEYRTAEGSLEEGVESDYELIKDWTGTDVDKEVLENLLCSFFINSMALHAPGGEILGSCLDPDAALMNHSCDPNADYYFEGPELRVRSTRTIPTGEEITISYTDPTFGFDFRQEQLRSTYFFECKCQKCERGPTGPGELTIDDPELDRRFKEAQDRLRQLLQTDETSPEVVEAVADRLCRDGYPGKPWPCDVQPMPQLWGGLATAYQDTNLVKALRFWLKTCLRADPLMRPSRYDFRRVEQFMKYLGIESAVVNLLCANDPTVRELQSLKSDLSVIQYPHVKRFVQDATTAFGEDSTIAHVARISERKWDDLLAMQGTNLQGLMSFWASAEGISELKREEAKLLDWAEN